MSVPFPKAPATGDTYSIWTFSGVYWLLTESEGNGGGDGGGGGASTWAELRDKPQPIEQLGNENEIEGSSYQASRRADPKDSPDFWRKK